jgi:hypothetical protein
LLPTSQNNTGSRNPSSLSRNHKLGGASRPTGAACTEEKALFLLHFLNKREKSKRKLIYAVCPGIGFFVATSIHTQGAPVSFTNQYLFVFGVDKENNKQNISKKKQFLRCKHRDRSCSPLNEMIKQNCAHFGATRRCSSCLITFSPQKNRANRDFKLSPQQQQPKHTKKVTSESEWRRPAISGHFDAQKQFVNFSYSMKLNR